MYTKRPPTPHHSAAGRLNVLIRYHGPDHPTVVEARAQLREARLAEDIVREAESDPPLDAERRARLAVLLLHPNGEAS